MAKKMTLVQCADALGITNPALSQWEQGKREPKFAMLIALCLLLDTTPNDILGFVSSASRLSSIKTGSNSQVAIGNNIKQTVVNSKNDSRAGTRARARK
ncbi:MAG: helix-turn-helix transcriptional regulator [Kiritimatiellae bacterium]|nr:helix-turn-helix transcriptional regulator [Kiritimatiellia bacterium]